MTDIGNLEETCQAAQRYYYLGDMDNAIKLYNEAADGYEETSQPVLAAKALILAGKCYQYVDDYQSPLLAFRRALRLIAKLDEPVVMASLLRTRALIQSIDGHLVLSYEDLKQAEKLLFPPATEGEEEIVLDIGEGVATWAALAHFYLISGEWSVAKSYLEKAADLVDETDQDTQYDLLVDTGRYHLMVRGSNQLATTVDLLFQICPQLGTERERPVAWLQYFALRAHSANLAGNLPEAQRNSRKLFKMLDELPDQVSDRLSVATEANDLMSYQSKLP